MKPSSSAEMSGGLKCHRGLPHGSRLFKRGLCFRRLGRGITEIRAETGREIHGSHQNFIEDHIQTSELSPDLNATLQYF